MINIDASKKYGPFAIDRKEGGDDFHHWLDLNKIKMLICFYILYVQYANISHE